MHFGTNASAGQAQKGILVPVFPKPLIYSTKWGATSGFPDGDTPETKISTHSVHIMWNGIDRCPGYWWRRSSRSSVRWTNFQFGTNVWWMNKEILSGPDCVKLIWKRDLLYSLKHLGKLLGVNPQVRHLQESNVFFHIIQCKGKLLHMCSEEMLCTLVDILMPEVLSAQRTRIASLGNAEAKAVRFLQQRVVVGKCRSWKMPMDW